MSPAEQNPNHRIRNVVFDLGGVLLEWNPDGILAQAFDDEEMRRAAREAVFAHEDWMRLDAGELSEAQAVENFGKRLNLPKSEIERMMTIYKESLRPLPDSMALLDELEAMGIDLYCPSNINAGILEYLKEQLPFMTRFRGIVNSDDEKVLKPNPLIFQRLLDRYALRPEETAFVDDNPANAAGAEKVGIHGIAFQSADQCRRELRDLLR